MCSTRENSPAVENEQNNSTLKKGNPQNPENYSPNVNLNHLGKIYEKLILKRAWSMMGDSLPSSHQHGFDPQHGTDTATTTILSTGLLNL